MYILPFIYDIGSTNLTEVTQPVSDGEHAMHNTSLQLHVITTEIGCGSIGLCHTLSLEALAGK
jgi:hypothetical protein